jgi:Concanavalin A-like lectin/glucanases superfamily
LHSSRSSDTRLSRERFQRAARWAAVAVALFALFSARAAVARTCRWNGSGGNGNGGRFNRANNWTCSSGSTAPGSGDDVVFDATNPGMGSRNNDCSFNAAVSVNSVTITSGYTAGLTGSANSITVATTWTQSGTVFSGQTGSITIGGLLTVSGGTFTSSSGTTTLSGGVLVNGGTLSGGGGAIGVTGPVTVSSGTLSPGTSNLTASGDISVSGGAFTGGSGTVTTDGNLSITGGTFTASSTTTQVTGNFSNAATFTANGGTVSLVGTGSGGTITSGGYSFSGLTLNGSGGTYTLLDRLSATGTLTVTAGTLVTDASAVALGGLTINGSGGTFNAPTGTLTLSGAFNRSAGTFNANGGTVYFSGTGALSHTFGGATFANVQVGMGTSGMVGYWKLDETSGTIAADSSGNGNNGTYSAGGVTQTAGHPTAVTFTDPAYVTLDGSSGTIQLGATNFPVNNAPQSMSLWFKGIPNGGNENMIALINANGSSANQLGYRGANLVLWSYGGTPLVQTTAPTDGNWHHVIYTYDGVTDSLYLDGTLANSSTTAVHQTSAPATAYLGTYSPNAELWSGSLDDVRVYNRALTAGEISLLAGGSAPSTVSGTHTFADAFSCTGNFSILAGTVTGSAAFSVGGNWLNGGTFSSTGTVSLTGTAATGTVTTGGSPFGALTIGGSGTYTIDDNVTVSGDLNVNAGTLAGPKTVTVKGSFKNAATYSVTGMLTLASASTTAKMTSGNTRLPALTVNGSGTYTLQDRLWVPAGTITVTAGTLNDGGQVIHAGAFSVGAGSYAPGGGTLVIDGTSNSTLPLSSLASLRIEDPSEANLVGYWKLDENGGTTIKDLSGNGNTGTLSSAGVTWNSASGPGSKVAFDDYAYVTLNGSSGYASLGVTNLPATDAAITISSWVNVSNASGNQNIVALSGSGLLQFGIRGGSYVVWPSGAATTVTGPAVSTGGWHHVAYTYSGTPGAGADIIYVDGVAYPGTFTHQSGATTAAYLGTFSGASEFFNGSVDDVRIYNVALSARQVAQLAAGHYAGTGGGATVTLGTSASLTGLLALDDGSLTANGNTLSVGTTAEIDAGTYLVGSAAQTFAGGLTVNPYGTLTLASSGGSVNIGANKTLTIDGTLNASSTGATIQAPSTQTFTFTVGSTSSMTPTVNVSALVVKGTNGGMQIGASKTSTPNITQLDNVAFSAGTGAQYLLIRSASLFLNSNGCTFDAGQSSGGPSKAIVAIGNGGDTRAIFGGTTCAANWYVSSSDTSCTTTAKSDDDSDNDGVSDSPGNGTNFGAVVQFVRSVAKDTAGSVIGFPTAAFDWNTFTYYSTYVAFHNASGGSSDVIYVRDESGNPLYSWTVPTAGEAITGTPQWITSGSKHYLYVATTQGHVYRLVDTGTGNTSGTLSLDTSGAWSSNPFSCGCTISTPLAMDASNLYWNSTSGGNTFWTLGQATESNPTPVVLPATVTSAGLSIATINGTSYAFLGTTGDFLRVSTLSQSMVDVNASPGSSAIKGRVVVAYSKTGTYRVYGGDDGGTMWALDPSTGFTTLNGLWHYAAGSAIRSSPYYDHDTDTVHFGTDAGSIVVLNAATGGTLNSGYPFTPAGASGDKITAAPLYYNGVLVIGSVGGKLYFIDRNTGTTPAVKVIKQFNFGSGESVSGIGFDPTVNRYMVTTANSSANDGRVYYFDLVTDPTAGST